jgi:hypothetical protein
MDRDVAAPALVHAGKPSYGVAGATNTTGGSVALLGANGLVQITGVTQAGTTGDTITINYLLMTGAAATPVVLTEGAGAGEFDCDGAATDDECVENFCATFNANAGLEGYLYCEYTAATETAAIVAVEGMVPFITSVVASDAVNFVLTRGTDGITTMGSCIKLNTGYVWTSGSDIAFGLTCGAINMTMYTSAGVIDALRTISLTTTGLEADLVAGACTAGTWKVDNAGTRELCRCNDAGSAYDCISVTTANGPTD